MKALLFLLVVALGYATENKPATTTLTLKNGKVFRNVKITSETDDAIYVRYNAGMVKIFKSELSPEMQRDYPTPEQRADGEAEIKAKHSARVTAEKEAEAAENLARIKQDHPQLITKITKPTLAERQISAERFGQPLSWSLSYDEPGLNLLFVCTKAPGTGGQETRFVFEVPEAEFQNMVSIVSKFENWCSICGKESPKPTVEKVIGTLGSIECIFRYGRNAGGTLWIGSDVLQEDDAKYFLALSTTAKELMDENREIHERNQSIAERLR